MISCRAALTALLLTVITPAAWAQTPPPAAIPGAIEAPTSPPAAVQAPPQGYAPPPAGYAPTPPAYAPAPAYAAPPPGYRYVRALPPGPPTLPYNDGYPIPDGYHPEMRMKKGLAIAGGATFGALYLISAASAVSSSDKSLLVPIVGPFLALGHIDFSVRSSDGGSFAGVAAAFAVIDGLGQLAGAGMLLAGLTQKSAVLVREDPEKVSVRVTPLTMGNGGIGIGLIGAM